MSSQVIDGWKPIRGTPGKTIVTQNSDGSYTVTIDPSAIGDGSGDMLKAVYDIDGNDIVDAAESVPWGGVTGKPLVFPPDEHTHSGSDVTSQVSSAASADSVPWAGVTDKPLVFPPDEHTHSGSDVTSQVSSAASADSVPWTGVTDKPLVFPPDVHTHDDRYYTESEIGTLLGGYVLKTTFDANSLLIANTDDTPVALSVGASTLVGRAASGGIAALSASDARTVLGLATTDAPTFGGLTDSSLTASRLVASSADKKLTSVGNLASWVAGTSNQIVVTDDTDGTITLSFPSTIWVVGSGTTADAYMFSYRESAFSHAKVSGYAARGTLASPGQILSGDQMFMLSSVGYTNASNFGIENSQLSFSAAENFTSTAQGCNMELYLVTPGTTSRQKKFVWSGSGIFAVGNITPTISDGVGVDINGKILRLRSSKTPASASDTGNVGEICWDANYVNVAVGTNTWKKTPLVSAFAANSIIYADTSGNPANLTVGASTIIGRAASGGIAALSASEAAAILQASIDHGSIAGLSDDDHTGYALLAGRSGGQTLIGGTGAAEDLTLKSGRRIDIQPAANSTAAVRVLNSGGNAILAVDTTNNVLALGAATPTYSTGIQEWHYGGVLRSILGQRGAQDWYLNDGSSEAGTISYGTPNGSPGITFYGPSLSYRFDFFRAANYFGLKYNADSVGFTIGRGNLGAGIGTTAVTLSDGAGLDINGKLLRLRSSKTPASASATGNVGEICWDSNYVYVAVGANQWKRAALSTW